MSRKIVSLTKSWGAEQKNPVVDRVLLFFATAEDFMLNKLYKAAILMVYCQAVQGSYDYDAILTEAGDTTTNVHVLQRKPTVCYNKTFYNNERLLIIIAVKN